MERDKVLLVLIAFAISSTSGFNHLTPWDKEIIYNWNALVEAGTDLPTPHASQFLLTGKVHLQSSNNCTLVQIKDLTYKLYNGILDNVHEHEAHSVPVQIPDLEKAFKIIYNTNGLAIGIVTDTDEKEFSRNMKKAMATVLQMDDSVLKQDDHQHHHSYILKEHSIYGKFDVDYIVRKHKDNEVIVQKLHQMKNSHHLYQHMVTSYEPCHCDMNIENQLNHISRRDYHIVTEDGHQIVKKIHTVGMLANQPFRAKSDHQFVVVNQTLELHQMIPISQKMEISSGHFEDHLTYHFVIETQDGSVPDVTNGRHVVNHDKLLQHLQEMLNDAHQYLHEDHIHTHEPDTKRGQLINIIQRYLQMLTLTKLQELHKKLSGDALTMMHHMLPLVGTKASTLFIKHLVVDKVVDDDTAMEMLQHMSDHMVEPTVDLLTQLEVFMHLDNCHWNVQKSAILAFATMIHKSHMFVEQIHENKEMDHHISHPDDHQNHDYSHQQLYEKYVVEYIKQIRSSQEHKVRMAYMFGLFNMKMHSIIEHILPGVRGDWFGDYHSRILSLWALGSAATQHKDSDALFETVWPIFVDETEITEMRTLAFYFLTYHGKMSHSRMMNMHEYLMREKNMEVYRYAYTTLQGIANSNDDCMVNYRMVARQLVQMLPKPTHGKSFAKMHDYRDVQFGFSQSMNEYFINGNHALMYGFKITSQHIKIIRKDYMMYIKVHGLQTHGDPSNMLFDMFRKKSKSITSNQEFHVECVMHRHNHVINVMFFDKNNLHELEHILNFFTQEKHSMTKNMLEIMYEDYYQAIIPTDLGIPALWEFLKPQVYHTNITMTKETVSKVANVKVDSRYVNWAHIRNGLAFYNPIADVWQGINRLHAYDAVLPLHFEISLNTQQKSVQISWHKHTNHQQNVAGIRSHVKQTVFVKDDSHRNILGTSSPHSKAWVTVTHGKEFRNEYTIAQSDDISTGQKWHVAFYDSSRYMSNGSFQHILDLFKHSHLRPTESLMSSLLKTSSNFFEYLKLLPKAGTYGFMARLEPSHQYDVTNIDLSIRLHSEPMTDDSYHYSPKTKWSTRMTYAVKNQDTSLRTWDMNTIIDMNAGHTVNNMKMHITRIIPSQKDWKICVEGMKKWSETGVEGHLNIAMSQTNDSKCVKDDTMIDVTMIGKRSEEQHKGHHKYHACEYINPYSLPHTHSLQCLVDHTTARHYTYDVKTMNMPTKFRNTFAYWWDTIKGHYMSYYTYEDEHHDEIAEHNLKIDVMFPMQAEEVDVLMTTPQHVYQLSGIPTHQWKWLGIAPDSIDYPEWFQFLHEIGFVDHCVVGLHQHHMNLDKVKMEVPKEWTLFAGNKESNPEMAVYVKQIDQKMAVKIVDHSHTIEIVPHGANHQIMMDGQVVPESEYHHEEWGYFHVFTQDSEHPVAVMMQNSGIHVEYNEHKIVMVLPKMEQPLHGHCYQHK